MKYFYNSRVVGINWGGRLDVRDGGWRGRSAEALLQVPALIYVCGDRLWCRADEETALSTSALPL